MKYLLIRILGNNILNIHGNNQTYNNLKFTIENETKFVDTDKIYVLNRIINDNQKNNIIDLLNKYNIKFLDIPFVYDDFIKIPKINSKIVNLYNKYNITKELSNYEKKLLANIVLQHSLYLVNINSCRNFCIQYGKDNNYDWTFVLDSNSFFTDKYFNDIINNINEKTQYIAIPQIRIAQGKYNNTIILKAEENINLLDIEEPQVAFKNSSLITFNPNIPYGIMNKAELLNAIGVIGKWNNWIDIDLINIKPRYYNNIKFQVLSKVIRLNPENINNNNKTNWINRLFGVYDLYLEVIKKYGRKTSL